MRFRLLLIALLSAAVQAEPTSLRYELQPGQELVYRSHYRDYPTTRPAETGYESASLCTIRVVSQNPDGSWQAIQQSQDCKPDFTPTHDAPTLVEFTVTPRGKVTIDPSLKDMGSAGGCFVEFPPDDSTQSWNVPDPDQDATLRYRRLPATVPSAELIELQSDDGLFARLYKWKSRSTSRFDRQKGLITQVLSHNDDARRHETGEGLFELIGEQRRDAAWMRQYATQVHTIMAAKADYMKFWRSTTGQDTFDVATGEQALTALRTAADAITLPELNGVLPPAIKAHAESVKNVQEEQAMLASILHKPAAGWKLLDLQGNAHTLAEQHGKVVVLDFWYRGCGWCMKAMPSMKQLAEDYKDKPVVFFGMNVDNDIADAQFVVDFFKLPYLTLRTTMKHYNDFKTPATVPSEANNPDASYWIEGYPTVIVIDGNGVLQLREVGYSPDLRQALGKKIDELLAQPTAAAR